MSRTSPSGTRPHGPDLKQLEKLPRLPEQRRRRSIGPVDAEIVLPFAVLLVLGAGLPWFPDLGSAYSADFLYVSAQKWASASHLHYLGRQAGVREGQLDRPIFNLHRFD